MPDPLRIATVNANGVRAAYRKGMAAWVESRGIDILAIQEVRAETADVEALLGPGWNLLHDASSKKGYAGVALASRREAGIHRATFGPDDFDSAGRWLEADYDVDGTLVTVVSCYVHSGEVGTPRQDEKWRFLDGMLEHLPKVAQHNPLSVVAGDLNVGHRTLDIKNWRGNLKRAGFLPEERAYFDRFVGAEDDPLYNRGAGLGWVDVHRRFHPDEPGPYTWWSQRGKAFDNDTGWRIDYQLATSAMAERALRYTIDRAPSYDSRWSDHAPVVVDYRIP